MIISEQELAQHVSERLTRGDDAESLVSVLVEYGVEPPPRPALIERVEGLSSSCRFGGSASGMRSCWSLSGWP